MMLEIELHDEVVKWLDSLSAAEWDRVVVIVDRLADLGSRARRITYRFTKDARIVLLTTFHKQRDNERGEVARARAAAADCARRNP